MIYHARRGVPWFSGWTCWVKFQGDVWLAKIDGVGLCEDVFFLSVPSKYPARTDGQNPSASIAIMFM